MPCRLENGVSRPVFKHCTNPPELPKITLLPISVMALTEKRPAHARYLKENLHLRAVLGARFEELLSQV